MGCFADAHHLVQIAQSPSLEAIEVRSPDKDSSDPPPPTTDPRVKALLTWAYNPERQGSLGIYEVTARPPLDPTFRPLLGVPQTTADAIWSRILFFAMLGLPQNTAAEVDAPKRLPFLFVSKLFYRLALPHFYRLPSVHSTKLRSLADALAATPALGAHVRVLEIRQLHSIQFILTGPPDPGTAPADILRHTPHLRRLLGNGRALLPWTALCALAQSGGDKLEEISGINITRTADGSVTVLARFTALRVLTWDTARPGMNSPFPIADLFHPAEAVPAGALPALEILTIKSPDAFAPFAQMELPNLRCVSVDTIAKDAAPHNLARFLRAHGRKLWSLCVDGATVNNTDSVLVLCPNMSTLTCRVDSEAGYDLGDKSLPAGFQHGYLTTLILNKNARPHQNKLEEMSWTFFFRCRFPKAHERLPALRELQIMVFEWPTTEHNISKNFWVQTAEKLAAQGIKLTDSTGTEWHPRLKAKRASKS
ncbi:hypothetical protein C8R46DRAFT_1296274 [Mycena filopes]|nr:hypothetical protein C8R46DRAFT_1296274 [Mycena filopes]